MNTQAQARTQLPARTATSLIPAIKAKQCLAAAALGLAIAGAPLASQAQSLDIKTGEWETTETTTIQGNMMPKEVLDQMPPERRAKIEQSMRARAAKPTTHTTHSCVTKEDKEDIARSSVFKADNPKCTQKVISHSSSKLEYEVTCPKPEARKAHFKIEAKSTQNYVGSADITLGEGGKMHMDMTGRWLAAVCKKGGN